MCLIFREPLDNGRTSQTAAPVRTVQQVQNGSCITHFYAEILKSTIRYVFGVLMKKLKWNRIRLIAPSDGKDGEWKSQFLVSLSFAL